jgi:hypothetical protein
MEKLEKERNCDIFSTGYDDWGHDKYLVEALCLTNISFSFQGMLVLSWPNPCLHHGKNHTSVWSLSKPAIPKVFGLGLWKLVNIYVRHIRTHRKKIQVSATFRDNAIWIFVLVSFCAENCAIAVLSEKVWYIKSCPETQPLGIESFPAGIGSPRHYSIRRNCWQGCIFRGRVSSAEFKSFSF